MLAEAARSITERTRRGQWGYALAAGLALASILLKTFQWYRSRVLWLDEEMIFLNIRDRTISELAGPLWMDQTAPFGWLVLQRGILQSFGTEHRTLRALSVLFAIATVGSALWVARRWMKPAGAAVFVFLCGFTQWMTFYALEAKPYATDAFWGLLLPALAVWATEGADEVRVSLRRSLVWWIAAIVGQWISYGALFVAPACVIVLLTIAWRRHGFQRALVVALQGIPWLISFGAHYYFVIRHARANSFLVNYWLPGLPPRTAGFGGALEWIAQQAQPLANHPGGTTLWAIFWLIVIYGFAIAFRKRSTLIPAFLLVVLSASLFAILRLVPLADRIAFWALPALYVPIALAADDCVRRVREALKGRTLPTLAVASAMVVMFWLLLGDMAQRSRDNLFLGEANNHGLNDRAAVSFLMTQGQQDDVFLTTRLGLPGLWWYAGLSVADPNAGRRYFNRSRILELTYERPNSSRCRTIKGKSQLQRALAKASRAAVHLGFDSNNPLGFQELVLDTFSDFSRLVSLKLIGPDGIAAIFDLGSPPEMSTLSATQALWRRSHVEPKLAGCVVARPARRW